MIENQINLIKPKLNKLIDDNKFEIKSLNEKLQQLIDESVEFGRNWVGAWASNNYNFYNDFTVKRSQTVILDEEYIWNHIEKKTNTRIEDIGKEADNLLRKYQEFQEELITEFSVFRTIEGFQNEIEILDKIEHQEWGITPMQYVKMNRPQKILTHNPGAILNKGLDTPPHFNVDGQLVSLLSRLTSIEVFEKNAKRLIRQIEIKSNIDLEPDSEKGAKLNFLTNLFENFHKMAVQLRNRHSGRPTLEIHDEYDVQDLMHGILKIQFEDIRAEEYTPSYAGSSTRVDFLLKKENVVIEVKKTREGLKDKQVGDQLLLDTLHYRSHPDCKHLICFVYDPEGRIINPRGLEQDLMKNSNDELIVEVFIRP